MGSSPWGRKTSDTTVTNTFNFSLPLARSGTIRCRHLQIPFYFLYKVRVGQVRVGPHGI